MLLMSSLNDVRVPYWMSLKYVSKLRHAMNEYSNTSNLILLKTDFESGHFGTGTLDEVLSFAFQVESHTCNFICENTAACCQIL